jgi:hypothetical protein
MPLRRLCANNQDSASSVLVSESRLSRHHRLDSVNLCSLMRHDSVMTVLHRPFGQHGTCCLERFGASGIQYHMVPRARFSFKAWHIDCAKTMNR